MAVNSYDPTDGHPVFLDTDAPDIKVDPTKVSEYAAAVGTRLIGTTAQRTGYGFAREGLCWYDTTLNQEFIHDGTGWVVIVEDSGWTSLTLLNSWLNFGGGYTPAEYRKRNGVVFVRGSIKSGTTTPGVVLANLPAGYRPAAHFVAPAWAGSVAASVELLSTGNLVIGAVAFSSTWSSFSFSFPADA